MTIRDLSILAVILSASVSLQGCAPRTCESLCQWLDDVAGEREQEPWADCQEVCEQDYSQASNHCRRELRDLTGCVDGLSAESAWSECEDELAGVDAQCACSIQECLDECAVEHGLRTRTATCIAINDTAPTE